MPPVTRRSLLCRAAFAATAGFLRRGSAAPSAYRDRVLAKRPVAFWPLDETSGPVAHDLGNNARNGDYRGAVAFRQPGPIRGESSAAIGLNGIDACVEVPDSPLFSQQSSGRGLTVEAWFRPDTLLFAGQTGEHYVHWLGKGQAGEFEWGMRFYSRNSTRPNRVSAYLWNPSSEPGVPNEGAGAYFEDPLRAGVWIHVVACFDPGDARSALAGVSIYKNAELRHGPSASRGARYSSYAIHARHGSAPLRLGTRDRGSYLSGALADVAIYPRVLSAREIRDNYLGA
jgi:hypothetical protein